ncbi:MULTISPECIES: hypothetical protein [unclassified Methanoculleus]|jgi:hypothetical protein|uniref:Uncharacterized protein n=1 Tax=Methanoculleus palmolei TaxID=72612 RepID=A0ABD8ABG5_9EURY|nr:hypothetical protein [Methanoculleus sp. UBA377]WOX56520.1 hypothetical protein R6Y95_04095 [Methanoculleus palmolei]
MKVGSGFFPFLAVLILCVLISAGAVSATPSDLSTSMVEKMPVEEISEADIQAGIEYLNAHDHVLHRYGTLPALKDTRMRCTWEDSLDKFVADARCDIEPLFYPEGPIHGFGYDIEGYVFVSIVDNRTMDSEAMDNLYGTLESRGRTMGISNIPVKFISSPLVELDSYPPESRSSYCRPIIGGLMLQTSLPGGTGEATTGFAAQTSSGSQGYVISGHCTEGAGTKVYQPTIGFDAGTVSTDGGTYSDAAWVPFNNVVARIYTTPSVTSAIKGYYSDPGSGLSVVMSGKNIGTLIRASS